MKVESLKNYEMLLEKHEYKELATTIYLITSLLLNDLEDYENWYFAKEKKNIDDAKRDILFIRNPRNLNEIIGVSCVKKNKQGPKISGFYVAKQFKDTYVYKMLLDASHNWLEINSVHKQENSAKNIMPIMEDYCLKLKK